VKTIKTVIYIDEADAAKKSALEQLGVKVISFEEVEALGKANPVEEVAPSKDDVAVYMFTRFVLCAFFPPPKFAHLTLLLLLVELLECPRESF